MAVNAQIGGSVSGQLTIGDHNVQLRADGGTVVYVAPPAPPRATARPRPVALRPRRIANFVDRSAEQAAVVRALGAGPAVVEICGEPGVGKTALLRTLAYDASAARYRAGVVYLAQSDGPFEDVLFEIGDALFDFDPGYVPTHVQLRHLVAGADLLLLLDDPDADAPGLQQLLDAVPDASAAYAVTSTLGLDSAVRVPLAPFGADDVRALASAAGADPAAVAGALPAPARPADVLRVAAGVPPASPAALTGLSEAERAVLGVLALVPGDRIPAGVVVDVAGRPDAATAIASLERRRLVESEARSETAVRLAPDIAALPEARAFAGTGASPRRLLSSLIETPQSAADVRRRGAPVEHLAAALLASGDAAMILWLAQRFGEYLAAAGALGRWERLLQLGLNAARTTGNRAAEGWMLHELGTRALLVHDAPHAEALLHQALSIRTAIGDGAGIRATRHNLEVLLGVPPAPPAPPARGARDGGDFPVGMLALVMVLAIAGAIVLGFVMYRSGALPGASPIPVASVSPSPSPSPSPEATPEPTPIPLLLPTLTPEPESPSPSPDAPSPAPSDSSSPAYTPRPLTLEAFGGLCGGVPGVVYTVSAGATAVRIRALDPAQRPYRTEGETIQSPPPKGCMPADPGRYIVYADSPSQTVSALAYVRPVATLAPSPRATPVPTPTPPIIR